MFERVHTITKLAMTLLGFSSDSTLCHARRCTGYCENRVTTLSSHGMGVHAMYVHEPGHACIYTYNQFYPIFAGS
jgi:hypothetical protein